MSLEEWIDQIVAFFTKAGLRILGALAILIVGCLVVKWITNLMQKSPQNKMLDRGVQTFLRSFFKVGLYIVVVLSAASVLGIPMTSFITVLASAGVTFGLAVQGSLANFAGGIMILLFHPFKVGDYIETETYAGYVKGINVFYTKLETLEKKVITLPNGNLSNAGVKNYFPENTVRMQITVGVAYGSDHDTVVKALTSAAKSLSYVKTEPAPMAFLRKQNDSSLDFELRFWVDGTDYFTADIEIMDRVYAALCNAGISIPFPQLDVHMK